MSSESDESKPKRRPLTRDRVLATAIPLADAGGLEALSMRTLARELGVGAMALYYHFRNKDELLDGMVDHVFGEIELPSVDEPWKPAMRRRAVSARESLARHPWAIGLMESRRNPGPANLRHHDAVLGNLLASGFGMAGSARAYSVLDSYIYGFALTKMNMPFDATSNVPDVAREMLEPFPMDEYPNLVAFITEHAMQPGYDYEDEFKSGLDLILASLERDRAGIET
jgi:AcrR family transcriptional regulator